jgi:small ligand-binding sensory domain FIST
MGGAGGVTMMAVKAYYDGQNYITDSTVEVKTNQRVIITFLDEYEPPKRNLKKYVGKISKDDSDLVSQAVSECRKVDSDEW